MFQDPLLVRDLPFIFFTAGHKKFMHRDGHGQIITFRIHVEPQHWRAVFPNGINRVGKAGVPAFDQMELLQEITDPPVAVNPGTDLQIPDLLICYAAVESRKAGDLHSLECDPYGDGFLDLVGTMIFVRIRVDA